MFNSNYKYHLKKKFGEFLENLSLIKPYKTSIFGALGETSKLENSSWYYLRTIIKIIRNHIALF